MSTSGFRTPKAGVVDQHVEVAEPLDHLAHRARRVVFLETSA
jgi:hypothetical protein